MSPSALTSFLGEWVGNPTQAVVRRSRWQQPSGKWIAEVLKKHCLITVYVLGASALEKGKVWLEMIHKKQTNKKCSPLLQTPKPPIPSPHQRPSNFHLHRALARVELRKPKLGPETIRHLPQDKQCIQHGSGELKKSALTALFLGEPKLTFFL